MKCKVSKTVKLKSFLWVDYVDLIALHVAPSHFCIFAITPSSLQLMPVRLDPTPPSTLHCPILEEAGPMSMPGKAPPTASASQRCLYHSSPRSAGPQIPTNPLKSRAHRCTSVRITHRMERCQHGSCDKTGKLGNSGLSALYSSRQLLQFWKILGSLSR